METICFNLKLIKLELERKRSGPRALIADTGYNTMTGNPMLQPWISAMKTINQFKERACTLHCLYPAPSAKCIIANPRSSVPMARGMGGSSRACRMPAYFHQNNVVSADLQEELSTWKTPPYILTLACPSPITLKHMLRDLLDTKVPLSLGLKFGGSMIIIVTYIQT